MTDLLVSPSESAALDQLSAGLRDYQAVSGKLSAAILAQKGGQLLYGNQKSDQGALFDGLHQLYKHQKPAPGRIWEAARGRGFRVGRKLYGGGGLSPTAMARAREMMGGHATILVTSQADGSRLRFARAGVRKARVHYRWGRDSTVIPGTAARRGGEHAINLRAVATFFELQKREQGRGFLAASWLHRRWRTFGKRGYVPAGTPGLAAGFGPSRQFGGSERRLVHQNPRSQIQPALGAATLGGSEATGNVELLITSYVPGVQRIGATRGLFVRAINGVRADIETYIARKHTEALAATVRARLGFAGNARR